MYVCRCVPPSLVRVLHRLDVRRMNTDAIRFSAACSHGLFSSFCSGSENKTNTNDKKSFLESSSVVANGVIFEIKLHGRVVMEKDPIGNSGMLICRKDRKSVICESYAKYWTHIVAIVTIERVSAI